MDTIPHPAFPRFSVWYAPDPDMTSRPGELLRIGRELTTYHDALRLVDVVLADLPAYGFTGGEVLITHDASGLEVLGSLPLPTSPLISAPRPVAADDAERHRAVARLALEDLCQQARHTAQEQAAPLAWIDRLEQALQRSVGPGRRRHSLAGLHCVTVEYLLRHAQAILRELEEPPATNASLGIPQQPAHPLAPQAGPIGCSV